MYYKSASKPYICVIEVVQLLAIHQLTPSLGSPLPLPLPSSPCSLALSMAPWLLDICRLVHQFLFAVETCGLPTCLIVYQVHTAQQFSELEVSSQPHPRRTSGKNDRGGSRGYIRKNAFATYLPLRHM